MNHLSSIQFFSKSYFIIDLFIKRTLLFLQPQLPNGFKMLHWDSIRVPWVVYLRPNFDFWWPPDKPGHVMSVIKSDFIARSNDVLIHQTKWWLMFDFQMKHSNKTTYFLYHKCTKWWHQNFLYICISLFHIRELFIHSC